MVIVMCWFCAMSNMWCVCSFSCGAGGSKSVLLPGRCPRPVSSSPCMMCGCCGIVAACCDCGVVACGLAFAAGATFFGLGAPPMGWVYLGRLAALCAVGLPLAASRSCCVGGGITLGRCCGVLGVVVNSEPSQLAMASLSSGSVLVRGGTVAQYLRRSYISQWCSHIRCLVM